ncbi:MAG TPA: hypothetical protein ENK39_06190 [Epsilonproteobacteria bacterium]|nr:hypothetical protein [Campylobacterota bacterium]
MKNFFQLLLNGFKKFSTSEKQIVNFSTYILIFLVIKYFGEIDFTVNGESLALMFLGASMISSFPILISKEIVPNCKSKIILEILNLILQILQKYFVIVETGLGLLIIYSIYHIYFGINLFIIILFYIFIGSTLEASKEER